MEILNNKHKLKVKTNMLKLNFDWAFSIYLRYSKGKRSIVPGFKHFHTSRTVSTIPNSNLMVEEEKDEVISCLTTRELKAKWRPEFQANYQKYYPVKTFEKHGFSRAQCPKCKTYYWRHHEKADTCGDSKYIYIYIYMM